MRKDLTSGYGARSSLWRSLPESEMCAVLVVVAHILTEPAFQVAFVNCDDVIQEITPATPYPTLCDSIGMSVQLCRMAMLKFDVFE